MRLQAFTFDIIHVPGKQNVVPDFLSRTHCAKIKLTPAVGEQDTFTKKYEQNDTVPEDCWRRIRAEYDDAISDTKDEIGHSSGRRADVRQIQALLQACKGQLKRVWTSLGKGSQEAREYMANERGMFLQHRDKCLEDWIATPTGVSTTEALLVLPNKKEVDHCFVMLSGVVQHMLRLFEVSLGRKRLC